MSARDFKIGDRVEGPYGAYGNVEAINSDAVHVRFSGRGGSWVGIYDDKWFRLYDGLLRKLDARSMKRWK